MRVFITGATGLIGRRLVLDRLERGDRVVVLSRDVDRAEAMFAAHVNQNITAIEGDPNVPGAWQDAIDGTDVVVHLAAAGIADKRWTPEYKSIIERSRIDATFQVAHAVREASSPPSVAIVASAVGLYGETGDETVDESAAPVDDFLGDLCQRWEEQANRMASASTRVVNVRLGIVLDHRGGALGQLIPLFRAFLGGPLGRGRHFMPWVHWRDVIGLMDHAIDHEMIDGPLNAVAPNPVRNAAFTKALARAVGRPAILPAPKFGVRLIKGEIASYLFTSQRVHPTRALESGYAFQFPSIDEAMIDAVRAPSPTTAEHAARQSAMFSPQASDAPNVRPPARIRLVAIDVDGTLLTSDGTISRGVIHACRAAHRAGVTIIPATSRPPRGMTNIMQMLDLSGPVITYNGALIWDPKTREPLYEETIEPTLARELIDAVRQARDDVLVAVEQGDAWYTDRLPNDTDGHGLLLTAPSVVQSMTEVLERPVTKLNIVGSASSIEAVRHALSEPFWMTRRIAMFHTDPRFLQIVSPLVDKGIALQRIARTRHVDRTEIMAIGDASNDLGMIEWAGFGVAVSNASDAVRELAHVTVPSNDEGGVARALQRYVLA